MSSLYVYHVSSPQMPGKVLTHAEDITSTLAEQGVTFGRWPASSSVLAGASPDEVVSANRAELDRIMTDGGFAELDVLCVNDRFSDKTSWRDSLLVERQNRDQDITLMAAGRGLLSAHIGDFVFGIVCEKNDCIGLPAGTPYWFDIGEAPQVAVIRLFKHADDRTPKPTGETIAALCARLEDC